jgi:ATP-dependent RNA helicase DeaD
LGSPDRQGKVDPGFRRDDERRGRGEHRDRDDAPAASSSPRKRGPSDVAPPGEKAPDSRFRGNDEDAARPPRPARKEPDEGFETFRIEVGHDHGVKPGNIVGAIANEAGLDAKHIGRVDIRDDHSFVDLPEGMPSDVFKLLKKVWVSGQQLRITRGSETGDHAPPHRFKAKTSSDGGFARPKRPKPTRPR